MTGTKLQLRGVALAGALLVAAACGRTLGGYQPRDPATPDAEASPADAAKQLADAGPDSRDAQPGPFDAAADRRDAQAADAESLPDSGLDPCSIPCSGTPEDRPVYVFGECTPPLQVGCPARSCTVGGSDCGEGYTCQTCGAAACCICAACVPACVFTGPAQGPLPEYLKISPTFGTAFQDQALTIEGFPFYVGALYYLARVGGSGDLFQEGGSTCSFDVTVPGQGFGIVPVWVSQYGGGEPWVLAGFFTFSGGLLPNCVQPGYPCSAGQECCETNDVPMGCISGRCRRK